VRACWWTRWRLPCRKTRRRLMDFARSFSRWGRRTLPGGCAREAFAVHRHDAARRTSVAAGHTREDVRPVGRRRRGGAPAAEPVQSRAVGGATFDTSMRFLQEDPWERLVQLRRRIQTSCSRCCCAPATPSVYTNYPDNVVKAFISKSAELGIDVFRVFDSLNSTSNMRWRWTPCGKDTDALCEAAICYTGDILDPARTKYSLAYYVKMARELEKMGAHVLAIKDMAGLLQPYAAHALVKALRDEIDLPIHFHTHDTSG